MQVSWEMLMRNRVMRWPLLGVEKLWGAVSSHWISGDMGHCSRKVWVFDNLGLEFTFCLLAAMTG